MSNWKRFTLFDARGLLRTSWTAFFVVSALAGLAGCAASNDEDASSTDQGVTPAGTRDRNAKALERQLGFDLRRVERATDESAGRQIETSFVGLPGAEGERPEREKPTVDDPVRLTGGTLVDFTLFRASVENSIVTIQAAVAAAPGALWNYSYLLTIRFPAEASGQFACDRPTSTISFVDAEHLYLVNGDQLVPSVYESDDAHDCSLTVDGVGVGDGAHIKGAFTSLLPLRRTDLIVLHHVAGTFDIEPSPSKALGFEHR